MNEFRTSCQCSKCGAKNENFRLSNNPRPWRRNKKIVHGLLRCTECNTLWNRDVNACVNMQHIAEAALRGEARPIHLRRAVVA